MVSFFKYSQNNNSNLTLRNSLIFSIYNKNINKKIYFKSNNTIKGSYIDPVLNDSIYIASNGLKKNVSFRKNEINYKKNITSKNFVSYFSQLEDNFLISNIYPNKYLNDLIIKSFQDQKVLTN